jgi:hypothetical protein
MARLTWFISLPGFALMLVGLAVVALRAWRRRCGRRAADARAVPALRLHRQQLDPAAVVDAALRADRAAGHRRAARARDRLLRRVALPRRLLTARAAVAALGGCWRFFLSQSLPLRRTTSGRGRFALSERIADAVAGPRGRLPLGARPGLLRRAHALFATPVWLQHGQLSGAAAERRQR